MSRSDIVVSEGGFVVMVEGRGEPMLAGGDEASPAQDAPGGRESTGDVGWIGIDGWYTRN